MNFFKKEERYDLNVKLIKECCSSCLPDLLKRKWPSKIINENKLTFKSKAELIKQAKKDGACSAGLEWARSQKNLEDILNNIGESYKDWCANRGYIQFMEKIRLVKPVKLKNGAYLSNYYLIKRECLSLSLNK